MGDSTQKENKTLLVIDACNSSRQRMERALVGCFERVIPLSDPTCAARIIELNGVTHILCGFYTSSVGVSAFSFIEYWRRLFSSIECAVVITDEHVTDSMKPVEVDAVVSKSTGIWEAVEALVGVKKQVDHTTQYNR